MKEIFPIYTIGYFINQPASAAEFAITRFELMEEPDVDAIHKHTFYEIIWIETGSSRQTIDHQRYDMAGGDLFFISPGQIHEFEEWRPVAGGSILFTADFFLLNNQQKDQLFEFSFLDNRYANPLLTPDAGAFEDIKQVIGLLWKEQQRHDQSALVLQALLHTLLAQIQRCVNENNSGNFTKKQVVFYKKFRELLEVRYLENWTAAAYADKLNITPHYLNLIVKQVTGKTASENIRSRMVLEAKRFLSFTDYTIAEITLHLGILDSSYFAKIFRAETGLSPTLFRSVHVRKIPY